MLKGVKQTSWNTLKLLGVNPGAPDVQHKASASDENKSNSGSQTSRPGKFVPYGKSTKEGKRMIRKN